MARLKKLIFQCSNSKKNCPPRISELNFIITDDPKDKTTYENIKFLYSGHIHVSKRKNLKKYSHTMEDYEDVEIIDDYLLNKSKEMKKGDLVYIQGLIKGEYIYDKEWELSFLQVCDNKKIAWKCMDGIMVYENVK